MTGRAKRRALMRPPLILVRHCGPDAWAETEASPVALTATGRRASRAGRALRLGRRTRRLSRCCRSGVPGHGATAGTRRSVARHLRGARLHLSLTGGMHARIRAAGGGRRRAIRLAGHRRGAVHALTRPGACALPRLRSARLAATRALARGGRRGSLGPVGIGMGPQLLAGAAGCAAAQAARAKRSAEPTAHSAVRGAAQDLRVSRRSNAQESRRHGAREKMNLHGPLLSRPRTIRDPSWSTTSGGGDFFPDADLT